MVTFSTPEEADVALNFLDKALFTYPAPKGAGSDLAQRTRQLAVSRWDGKEHFDKREDTAEEQERIDRWKEFLGGADDEESDEDNQDEELGEEENELVDTDEELEAMGADSDE